MSTEQTCPECKVCFQPYNNRRNVIFCSYRCQVENAVRSRREVRAEAHKSFVVPCLRCGVEFSPRIGQRYCSDACRIEAKVIRDRNTRTINCAICGSPFMTTRENVKYCSQACRHAGHAKTAKKRYTPEKNSEYRQRYRQRNNMSVRQSRYKNWYGITMAEYDAIFSGQGGKCGICGCVLKPYGRQTNLDHKHDASQKIRGILCRPCNLMLGSARDNPAFLLAAINYLAAHQGLGIVT